MVVTEEVTDPRTTSARVSERLLLRAKAWRENSAPYLTEPELSEVEDGGAVGSSDP